MKTIYRTVVAFSLCLTVAACLFGCGSPDMGIEETTIVLNEDGSLTSVVIEDFAKEYYDFAEFEEGLAAEVDAYNTRLGEERVKVSEVKDLEDSVRLTMEYAAGSDYASFNQVIFSYDAEKGTVTVAEPVRVRTVQAISAVSDGVKILSEKEASVPDTAELPATITAKE